MENPKWKMVGVTRPLLILLQEHLILHLMLRRIPAITINMGVVTIMEIMGNTIRAILIDFQDLSLCQPPSIPQRSIRIPHHYVRLTSFELNCKSDYLSMLKSNCVFRRFTEKSPKNSMQFAKSKLFLSSWIKWRQASVWQKQIVSDLWFSEKLVNWLYLISLALSLYCVFQIISA